MAGKTINQLIRLLGSEEIQEQLKKLGVDGEASLKKIQDATNAANAPLSKFSKTVSDVSGVVTERFSKISQGAELVGRSLGPLASGFSAAGSLLGSGGFAGAAALAAGTLLVLARNAALAITREIDHAAAIGVTVDQLRALQKWGREAGLSQEELTASLQKFATKAAGEATDQLRTLTELSKQVSAELPKFADGFLNVDAIKQRAEAIKQVAQQVKSQLQAIGDDRGKLPLGNFIDSLEKLAAKSPEVRQAISALGNDISKSQGTFEKLDSIVARSEGSFKALGISLLDTQGQARSTFDVLLDFADKFSKLPDGFQKAALAGQFFNKTAGPELVSALNQGRAGIEQIVEALRKAGIVFDEDAARQAIKAKQALLEFEDQALRLQRNLGTFALPALNKVLEELNKPITIKIDFDNAAATWAQDWENMKLVAQSALSFIGDMVSQFGQHVAQIFQQLVADATTAWQVVSSTLFSPISGVFDWIATAFDSAMNALIAKAQAAWDVVKSLFSSGIGGASGVGSGTETNPGGFASGGFTGNVGTSRIAGVVHGKEYVQPAWVVAKPGVLQFMELLRRSGDLSKTIQQFAGGFDLGGLVDGMAQSLSPIRVRGYAGGGMVAAGGASLAPVTINFGTRSIGGLMADADVVAALQREAVIDRMRSSRKPSRGSRQG